MAQFTVNATRFDPYKNFKFRVKWDGRYVAGVSKVSALKRSTEMVEHREGGDPSTSRKSPGRTKYEAVTLERGVTHDLEFERWANKVWNFGAGLGAEVSLKDFWKDISIEVYNEAGQKVLAYNLFRCWVSEYPPQRSARLRPNPTRSFSFRERRPLPRRRHPRNYPFTYGSAEWRSARQRPRHRRPPDPARPHRSDSTAIIECGITGAEV